MGPPPSIKSTPYTFSLDELKDVALNGKLQQDAGCDYYLANWKYNFKWANGGKNLWPDNGEFDWYDSLGDGCSYCASEGGKECTGGLAAGGRPQIKRIAFKGDPQKCVLANYQRKNQTYIIDGKTCDPKYRDPGNAEWKNVMTEYCSTDDNLVTKNECINMGNSELKDSLMKEYCNKSNSNALQSACVNWCDSNRTLCTRYTLLDDCVKVGLCDKMENCKESACTQSKVTNLKQKCVKYGLKSEQGLVLGACTPKGVSDFESKCADFDLELDSCNQTELQNKETLALQREALDTGKKNYEETKDMISSVLGTSTSDTTTLKPTEKEEDYTIYYIIAAIIIIILFSSFSSILLLASS